MAREELGRRLFDETEFSNPGADFAPSCGTCHFRGTDPRSGEERFWADSSPRSLVPTAAGGERRTTLRNTPALADLDRRRSFGLDGRWSTLEEAILAELTSTHFGWSDGEAERALDTIHYALLDPAVTDYRSLFQRAYRVDLDALGRDRAVELTVDALAETVRRIQTTRTAPWDAFAEINRIPAGPGADETPKHYAGRVHGRLTNQEGRILIKRPLGFSREAYEGFKTFFRVEGEASVGNCVSCHVPPGFTDDRFHDTGISRLEYEDEHGEGSWAELEVPGPEAMRPVPRLLAKPAAGPGHADLGHWGFVDPADSPQRRDDESDAAFLERMRATFRTRTLRNLGRTSPYGHDGGAVTIEDAVRRIVAVSRAAREGRMPGVDEEYRRMRLDESDVGPLVAFLSNLDEVGEEAFRRLLIELEGDDG